MYYPLGVFKGKKLKDVSDGYLLKLYDAGKAGRLKEYIENRIAVLRVTKKPKP